MTGQNTREMSRIRQSWSRSEQEIRRRLAEVMQARLGELLLPPQSKEEARQRESWSADFASAG